MFGNNVVLVILECLMGLLRIDGSEPVTQNIKASDARQREVIMIGARLYAAEAEPWELLGLGLG